MAEELTECLPEDSTLIADKAYDSSTFRKTVGAKGIKTCIPARSNRTTTVPLSPTAYRRRHRIENFFAVIHFTPRYCDPYCEDMASLKIDPRSQFWYACITLPSGKQTQVSTKLRIKEISREKALKYADTLESAYRQRRAENQFRRLMNEAWTEISGTPLPFSSAQSFLEGWLARRKHEVSPSSLLRYSSVVRDFLAFLGPRASEDLSSFSPADIRAFRDRQAASMSATSANFSVKVVRNAFKAAIRERLLTENPAGVDFIDPIKRRNENHRRRAFTVTELQKLLAVSEGTEWKGLVLAGLYLGQRLGDIARLTWANVDLGSGEISIMTEKTGRVQIIPIAAPLLRYFTEELETPDNPAAPLFPRAHENVQRLGRVGSLSR